MKKTCLLTILLMFAAAAGSAQTVGLKLSGGGVSVLGGDLSTGLQGQSDYLKAAFGAVDAFKFPKIGWQGTAEVLFYFGPNFAIGIGAGYEQHVQESSLSYSISDINVQETAKPAFNVIPILGSLHIFFPVGSAFKIDLSLGGGAYRTQLKWNSGYNIGLLGLSGNEAYTFTGNRTGYGAHAGLGMELALSSKLALVLNVMGRYAKVSGFIGDWTDTGTGDFWSFSESGSDHSVYFYNWTVGTAVYPQIEFRSDLPSGSNVANAREAKLDLSGISATIGFKINLF
jgi:hypothetical protein